MPFVSTSVRIGWLNLDWWTSPYVGAHWLATEELPDQQWQAKPHHGALSQLLLISSHHLVELMLFRCIREVLDSAPGKFASLEERLPRATFEQAFNKWPQQLGYAPFDVSIQPYAAIKRLQERRNATIHKDSALATLSMAKSALFTAVEGSRAIALHFRGANGFPYQPVLQKYPLPEQPWFTEVKFLDRPTEH